MLLTSSCVLLSPYFSYFVTWSRFRNVCNSCWLSVKGTGLQLIGNLGVQLTTQACAYEIYFQERTRFSICLFLIMSCTQRLSWRKPDEVRRQNWQVKQYRARKPGRSLGERPPTFRYEAEEATPHNETSAPLSSFYTVFSLYVEENQEDKQA